MTGRIELDRGKLKELVLYLSQESERAQDEGFGMVKLNKLLYRADFEAFRRLGHPITGETYIKQEFGPVARDLPIVLDDLAASGYVVWHHYAKGPYTRDVPSAQEAPDLSAFSEEELRVVREVLNELAVYGGKGVSEWSHEQSSGWRAVEIGQVIPYGSALVSTEKLSEEQMTRAVRRSRDEDWTSIRP